MPDLSGSSTREEHWKVLEGSADTVKALIRSAGKRGGRVVSNEGSIIELEFGSRFALRMFGIWATSKMMPFYAKLEVNKEVFGNGTSVFLYCSSNEGWYVDIAYGIRKKQYQRAFTKLFLELNQNSGLTLKVCDS